MLTVAQARLPDRDDEGMTTTAACPCGCPNQLTIADIHRTAEEFLRYRYE
jgi:hypothetical protein